MTLTAYHIPAMIETLFIAERPYKIKGKIYDQAREIAHFFANRTIRKEDLGIFEEGMKKSVNAINDRIKSDRVLVFKSHGISIDNNRNRCRYYSIEAVKLYSIKVVVDLFLYDEEGAVVFGDSQNKEGGNDD